MRTTSITSNTECAHRYGSITQSKWIEGTIVELKHELSKSVNCHYWYITNYYILGDDSSTKRFHISQRNEKIVPMPPPTPEPQFQNETAQEGNGALTVLSAVLYNEVLVMDSTVI